MMSESLSRALELFEQSLRVPPEERMAFLSKACGNDAKLQAEVQSLLEHDQRAGDDFMRPPEAGPERPQSDAPNGADPLVGRSVGRYRVLRLIGRGGMGAVYEAEQESPRRTVALKVIRAGLVSDSLLRRFQHEAQILGKLDHPGIATIFEAGTFDAGQGPQPFFAMELIKGELLNEYVGRNVLGTCKRLELVARIAEAVQHAHQKGVIHRDLKPGNILVNPAGEPKILDFGIARATDSDVQATTLQTDIGQLIGTIPYMSPEQAAGDPVDVDTRSDVYALGVVAYELLAGCLPYEIQGKMIHEAVRAIREDTPTPLSSVNKVFRGDIEIIIGKALEKDKARRYQSASDLANDIRRYLSDEVIVARPPSTWYQLAKFTRRNRTLVGGIAAVFLVLVAGIIGTSIGMVQAIDARETAQTEAAIAEAVNRFLNEDLLAAVAPEEQGRDVSMLQVLDAASAVIEGRFEGQPLVEASVRTTLGKTYQRLGQYAAAEPHLTRALALRRALLSEAHPATINSMNDLGLLYIHKGRFDDARRLIDEAYEMGQRVFGSHHADVATTLNNWAALRHFQGDYAQAERLNREALAMRRTLLGAEHPDVASSLNNLADSLKSQGKLEEAEQGFREALAIRRKVLGEGHPLVATSLNNLAAVLHDRQNLEEAELLYREALALHRRLLGDEHTCVANNLDNLALLLAQQRKPDDAQELHREALAIRRKLLDPFHPDIAASANNLAMTLHDLGRLDEAVQLYREALVINRQTFGEEHPHIAATLNNLAMALQAQGKLAEAEPYFRESLAMNKSLLGAEHPQVLTTMTNFSLFLRGLDKTAEAEALARETLEVRKRTLGTEHPMVATSLMLLALLLEDQARFAELEPVARQALEIRMKVLPAGSWLIAYTRSVLGSALSGLGRYEEAEEMLLRSFGEIDNDPQVPVIRRQEVIIRVISLYDRWGKPEEATRWRALLQSPTSQAVESSG